MKGQYLDYLHLRFDLIKARQLASRPMPIRLDAAWLPLPIFFMVDKDYQDGPMPIVATLALNDQKTLIVIDGIAVARQAVQEGERIMVVILSFLNTMNILTARKNVKRRIKDQGKILRLI